MDFNLQETHNKYDNFTNKNKKEKFYNNRNHNNKEEERVKITETKRSSSESKLNNGSSREIQMVLNYHTEVRFKRIIYRDARN